MSHFVMSTVTPSRIICSLHFDPLSRTTQLLYCQMWVGVWAVRLWLAPDRPSELLGWVSYFLIEYSNLISHWLSGLVATDSPHSLAILPMLKIFDVFGIIVSSASEPMQNIFYSSPAQRSPKDIYNWEYSLVADLGLTVHAWVPTCFPFGNQFIWLFGIPYGNRPSVSLSKCLFPFLGILVQRLLLCKTPEEWEFLKAWA